MPRISVLGFLSILWICWAPAAMADVVDLTIELEQQPSPRLHVTIDATTSPTGFTRFTLADEWGGNTSFGREVRKLRVSVPDGDGWKRLNVKNEPAHVWEVQYPPDKRIRVQYDLVSTIRQVTSNTDTYYRPIIAADLVHFIGHTALAIPEHLATTKRHTFRVRWRGFSEAGWRVASSFNVGDFDFEYHGLANDFVHSVFLAGPSLRTSERKVGEGRVAFALAGKDWGFNDRELIKLATRVIGSEQNFFGSHQPPYYVVTLIPVGTYSPNRATVGGTGLAQSFALFMTPKIELSGEQGNRVTYLLAHEHFHHYNGGLVQPTEPEELVYWFTEGFTDFYTRHLLWRAGLFTLEEYVDNLNEKLRDLHTSPVRDASNERIRDGFWTDPNLHKLPYLRGDILAVLLDLEIRRVSDGKRSVHDLMRELVNEGAADRTLTFTNEDLIRRVEKYTSAEYAERYASWIEEGKLPHIHLDLFSPCLKGKSKPIGEFDLGFDFEASRQLGRVRKVRKGSAAWHAGLRDGQKLAGWSVTVGDVSKPAELTIQGDNAASYKTIRYIPQKDAVLVPQFRIADPARCADVL